MKLKRQKGAKIYVIVTFSLEKEVSMMIDYLSRKKGISKSFLVNQLLEKALKNLPLKDHLALRIYESYKKKDLGDPQQNY